MTLADLFSHPCSKCGIPGLHACPGYVIPPPTEEDEKRLTETLRKIFEEEQNV